MWSHLSLFLLAFFHTTAFCMATRARNRCHTRYHFCSSVVAATMFILVFKRMFEEDMNLVFLPSYVLGTALGSCFGAKISMEIEKRILATSDGHLKEFHMKLEPKKIEWDKGEDSPIYGKVGGRESHKIERENNEWILNTFVGMTGITHCSSLAEAKGHAQEVLDDWIDKVVSPLIEKAK